MTNQNWHCLALFLSLLLLLCSLYITTVRTHVVVVVVIISFPFSIYTDANFVKLKQTNEIIITTTTLGSGVIFSQFDIFHFLYIAPKSHQRE